MKRLKVCTIKKIIENDRIKLSFLISKNENENECIWYEVEKKYKDCLCDDRIDGIVVSLLPIAMKSGYEVIESEYPISEKLYYNLTYHVIPQIYNTDKKRTSIIKIKAPLIDHKYCGKIVAAGMSRGVESFATLYEYGKTFEIPEYRISHFTYFNNGSHHGVDNMERKSEYSNRELYEGQLRDTLDFCKKYKYDLISVDSNLTEAIKTIFGASSFHLTHTFRNAGFVLILQKGIVKYYYSSAFNLDMFTLSLNTDSAQYEKWLLPYLDTENVEFYSSNQNWSRLEKIERIVKLEQSYDNLCVCLLDIKNCGICSKCKKTLMELDSLGEDVLDLYSKAFDVKKYKTLYRDKWFAEIDELRRLPGIYGKDYEEIYVKMKNRKFNR